MKQRVITGVIAAALFLAVLWYGKIPFIVVTYLLATIGLFELFRMRKLRIATLSGLIAFLTMWCLLLPAQYIEWLGGLTRTETTYLGISLLLVCMVISKNKFDFEDAGFVTLSVIYVGTSFYFLQETRELGLQYILLVLFMIWASDSGAYQFGRLLGKHKLWPSISPNKTIEGFIGGAFSAIAVSIFFYILSDINYSLPKFLLIAVLVATIGTLGDLVQSAFKRHFNVKDSGSILPGHGGILDRFDSTMYTLPILLITGLIG